MNINDFDFDLPEELIAQTPLEKRSESRLLILDPKTEELEDRHFYNIIDELEAGDALVLNTQGYSQPVSTVNALKQVDILNSSCLKIWGKIVGKHWQNQLEK